MTQEWHREGLVAPDEGLLAELREGGELYGKVLIYRPGRPGWTIDSAEADDGSTWWILRKGLIKPRVMARSQDKHMLAALVLANDLKLEIDDVIDDADGLQAGGQDAP